VGQDAAEITYVGLGVEPVQLAGRDEREEVPGVWAWSSLPTKSHALRPVAQVPRNARSEQVAQPLDLRGRLAAPGGIEVEDPADAGRLAGRDELLVERVGDLDALLFEGPRFQITPSGRLFLLLFLVLIGRRRPASPVLLAERTGQGIEPS
jgi:hypothetical protein